MGKRMRVFYDTEFREDGVVIDLISIGMIREDGKEFYAVSTEFTGFKVLENPWLMENVMSSIGHEVVSVEEYKEPIDLVITDSAAMTREQIRDGIVDFVSDIWPEFWAWYGAYDHVALCQLFGKMIDLPSNFPMFTCDIKQEQKRLGVSKDSMPVQSEGKHNALDDARFNKVIYDFLRGYA